MAGGAFAEHALSESEDVLGVFYGGPRSWGGKLVITNKRLLFAELDLGAIPDALAYVGGKAGVPGVDLGKTILDRVRASVRKDVWLRHIVAVEPEGDGGWFSAPGIRITTATGEVLKLGIVKSTTTLSKDAENPVIRDRAVALIRLAVQQAKSGPQG
jgi:hypothetical protein